VPQLVKFRDSIDLHKCELLGMESSLWRRQSEKWSESSWESFTLLLILLDFVRTICSFFAGRNRCNCLTSNRIKIYHTLINTRNGMSVSEAKKALGAWFPRLEQWQQAIMASRFIAASAIVLVLYAFFIVLDLVIDALYIISAWSAAVLMALCIAFLVYGRRVWSNYGTKFSQVNDATNAMFRKVAIHNSTAYSFSTIGSLGLCQSSSLQTYSWSVVSTLHTTDLNEVVLSAALIMLNNQLWFLLLQQSWFRVTDLMPG
jgi:hypothetical protein